MDINIKEIINFYSDQNITDGTSMEMRMLNTLHSLEIWKRLDDKERQSTRREKLVQYKIKSLVGRYKNALAYEEKVLNLIDEIICFLEKTQASFLDIKALNKKEELYLFRLRNMLICEKEMVNRLPKIKYVGHVPIEIVQPLFDALKNTGFNRVYNLERINQLYIEAISLHTQFPYKNLPEV